MPTPDDYDPKRYWNEKATKFKDDPERAARAFNPEMNRCIAQAQRRALDRALRGMRKGRDVSGARVLDFGCGSGEWTPTLSRIGASYVGIDISDAMVDICRSRFPDHRFLSYDGERIPLPDDSIDIAFSIAVLHHNALPAQDRLLEELSRCLKPGGALFLFEGVGDHPVSREFPRPRQQWLRALENSGFTVMHAQHYVYMPITALFDRINRRFGWSPGFLWRIRRLDAALAPRLSTMPLLNSPKQGRLAVSAVANGP